MSPSLLPRRAVLLASLALIGLAGCGRRGALEPPPEAGVDPRIAREKTGRSGETPPETVENTRKVRGVVPPKDPFILDPLL